MALDELIRAWIVAHRAAWLDTPMWLLSVAGRGGTIFAVIGLVLFGARRCDSRTLVRLLLALAMATVAADYVLKPLVDRQRPYLLDTATRTIGGLPHTASFPSGHTANATAAAIVLTAAVPALWLLWCGLATAVAYSRLYLGVHYPLDVLGGALVGWLAAEIARRLVPRRYS